MGSDLHEFRDASNGTGDERVPTDLARPGVVPNLLNAPLLGRTTGYTALDRWLSQNRPELSRIPDEDIAARPFAHILEPKLQIAKELSCRPVGIHGASAPSACFVTDDQLGGFLAEPDTGPCVCMHYDGAILLYLLCCAAYDDRVGWDDGFCWRWPHRLGPLKDRLRLLGLTLQDIEPRDVFRRSLADQMAHLAWLFLVCHEVGHSMPTDPVAPERSRSARLREFDADQHGARRLLSIEFDSIGASGTPLQYREACLFCLRSVSVALVSGHESRHGTYPKAMERIKRIETTAEELLRERCPTAADRFADRVAEMKGSLKEALTRVGGYAERLS